MSTLAMTVVTWCPGASSHSSGLIRKILFLTLVLVLFPLLTPKVHSSQVTLAWDANSESHLAGYKVYYGESSRNYDQAIDVGNQTSYSLTQIPDYQETYFAVTAYDKYGQESSFSEEVVWEADQPATVYVITASSEKGGSISPSGQVEVVSGDDAAFSIKPDDGFAIQDVVVNGISKGSKSSYTFINVTTDQSISASFSQIQVVEYGSLRANISPTDAVTAGAQWRVDNGLWQDSGAIVSNLNTGTYTVQFRHISGWSHPADKTVSVTQGNTVNVSGEYTPYVDEIEDKADILVIAPHPGDDLITAGGVIYSAVQTGKSVKVVYITNGDYDGIDTGYLRQDEAAAGQSWLGMEENSLIFLGYPEGYLINLFYDFPDEFNELRTDHGQSTTYGNRGLGRTDYHTYRWGSPAAYNKHNLIMDIQDILLTYRPEYILTTSEYDGYSDHAVTCQLMKKAMVNINDFDPQYNPTIYKTIVHWDGDWPEPIDRDAYYTEIPDLSETDLRWENRASIDIPYYAQTPRVNAISEHRSQGGLSGFMGSYVHKDEIFWVEKLFGNQVPPVPNAGFDQTVEEGKHVHLDASASFGSNSGQLTYQWAQTAGTAVDLSDPYAANPGFISPAGLNHDEYLVFQLAVSDGISTSLSDFVQVKVESADPYLNIARMADVSASTENTDSEQSAVKAQDGIVDGWPGDHTREWATKGEGAGAWLCMEWPDYHVSDRVIVYDRPNEDDHILGAALVFNSGAEVIELDALDVIAGGTEFKFKPVKFKNMCFIVDKVSKRTQNTGLAEIEVFGISSGTQAIPDTGENIPVPVAGNLSVTPLGDYVFEGRSGGPFRPNRATYTLTNTGEEAISWEVTNTKSWLRVSSERGTLESGESVDIVLSIFNRDTRGLGDGTHSDTVSFNNATNSYGDTTRKVFLEISSR